jgi:hypothetical protein
MIQFLGKKNTPWSKFPFTLIQERPCIHVLSFHILFVLLSASKGQLIVVLDFLKQYICPVPCFQAFAIKGGLNNHSLAKIHRFATCGLSFILYFGYTKVRCHMIVYMLMLSCISILLSHCMHVPSPSAFDLLLLSVLLVKISSSLHSHIHRIEVDQLCI